MSAQGVPNGYHSVTPYLVVRGAVELIDYLKKAFGAVEMLCMTHPDGRVAHAEVRIGDSVVMLADGNEAHPPSPATLHLFVEDCDAVYAQALSAGGKSLREPADQDHGDRMGGVADPSENQWWIATRSQ